MEKWPSGYGIGLPTKPKVQAQNHKVDEKLLSLSFFQGHSNEYQGLMGDLVIKSESSL